MSISRKLARRTRKAEGHSHDFFDYRRKRGHLPSINPTSKQPMDLELTLSQRKTTDGNLVTIYVTAAGRIKAALLDGDSFSILKNIQGIPTSIDYTNPAHVDNLKTFLDDNSYLTLSGDILNVHARLLGGGFIDFASDVFDKTKEYVANTGPKRLAGVAFGAGQAVVGGLVTAGSFGLAAPLGGALTGSGLQSVMYSLATDEDDIDGGEYWKQMQTGGACGAVTGGMGALASSAGTLVRTGAQFAGSILGGATSNATSAALHGQDATKAFKDSFSGSSIATSAVGSISSGVFGKGGEKILGKDPGLFSKTVSAGVVSGGSQGVTKMSMNTMEGRDVMDGVGDAVTNGAISGMVMTTTKEASDKIQRRRFEAKLAAARDEAAKHEDIDTSKQVVEETPFVSLKDTDLAGKDILLEAETKSAKDVKKLSKYGPENEKLLPPGATLQTDSIEVKDTYVHIKATEIDSPKPQASDISLDGPVGAQARPGSRVVIENTSGQTISDKRSLKASVVRAQEFGRADLNPKVMSQVTDSSGQPILSPQIDAGIPAIPDLIGAIAAGTATMLPDGQVNLNGQMFSFEDISRNTFWPNTLVPRDIKSLVDLQGAITDYTGTSYRAINRLLRGTSVPEDTAVVGDILDTAVRANTALSDLPQEDNHIYRGIHTAHDPDLAEGIVGEYASGSARDDTFGSTSTDPVVAANFAGNWDMYSDAMAANQAELGGIAEEEGEEAHQLSP